MPQGIVACVISIFVYYNIICSTCVCVVCVCVCVSLCYASAACSSQFFPSSIFFVCLFQVL